MDGVLQALGGDLRLSLLLLGGLLVLGIVVWELVQRRRARRADAAHRAGPLGQPREPTTEFSAATADDPLFASRPQPSRRGEERREPTLGMADMPIRERIPDPPLVDLESARSIDARWHHSGGGVGAIGHCQCSGYHGRCAQRGGDSVYPRSNCCVGCRIRSSSSRIRLGRSRQ